MNKGTIEDFCKLAPLSPESIEALNERRLMQSCGNHLPPNEASLSKHIAECEAQNEELRRIVRWYMRHSGVDMPEEMRVIFNKISGVNQRRFGMSDHKHDREIADGFTITKVCNCFRCSKEAACIKFSMMTGYKLYTNYRLCPMCSVEMMNFLAISPLPKESE